jgi:Fuc2NAc and GlcNAc transferase
MNNFAYPFGLLIFIFAISLALTYLIRYFAIKKKIIDIPNERSSHTIPTPRGGGLAIAITWYTGLTFLFSENLIDKSLYLSLLSGLLLVGVSLTDDILTISPKIRMFIQSLSAGLALYFLGGLQSIDLGFYTIKLPIIVNLIVWIGLIWFINLYNFLDGIDGYAASEAIFISAAFAFLTFDFTPAILAASTIGFLIWNWQKAKIFMGDVGSTLLGFTIAVLAIYYQNSEKLSILISLTLSSVFWFDATVTLVRRKLNKEQLSKAHRKHAYQRITQAGWSHQKTVLIVQIINLFLFTIILIYKNIQNFILLLPIISIVILFFAYFFVERKKKFPKE